MKLLTLISKKEVKLAPGTKRVPKEAYAELVSAQELIEKIQQEAVQLRADIAKEGELIFEESKKDGFKEGLAQWAQQIKLLEQKKEKVQKELEKVVSKVALMTTRKIIDDEIKQDNTTVVKIVRKHLKSVSGHKHVDVFVNKKDLDVFQENRDKLKSVFENIESLSIQAREDVSEGGAIIETEAGIIDARVESLWVTIEKTFDDLFNKKQN